MKAKNYRDGAIAWRTRAEAAEKTVARLCAPMPAEAYEALAALVAERDEARQATWAQDTRAESAEMWAEAAEAERDEAREVLEGSHARGYREGVREMEAEVARLREALTEAVCVIDGLSDQQAMQDDWWIEPRDRLDKLAAPTKEDNR